LFFGFFRETKKHFVWFVSIVLELPTGIKTTKTNRILLKQTEKISKKRSLLGGKFFSQFEPKQTETQPVSVVFWFAFSRNPKFFFVLYVLDQYHNNQNKKNLWYRECKRLILFRIARADWSQGCRYQALGGWGSGNPGRAG
jgi:hypothetical protein